MQPDYHPRLRVVLPAPFVMPDNGNYLASYLASGDEDILGMKDPPTSVLSPAQFVRLWESNLL